MASSLPPVKAAAFTFYQSLVSQADTDIFKTSVTLAAGDVKVSKDGGAFGNVATLPTEIGTSGVLSCPLSASEMDADVVVVKFSDAAGAEWQDAMVTIWTAAQTLDTTDGVVDGISAVKPDHKPTVAASGEASANVTYQAGVAVAAADANGNVPVVLYGTQPAVTFGQVKIAANVSGQGALDVRNSNAYGHGLYADGGNFGLRTQGGNGGQGNFGTYYGQVNSGATGAYNSGSTADVEGVDEAGIRAALGMAAADLDTQLAAIGIDGQDVADALLLAPSGVAAAGSAMDYLVDIAAANPAGSGAISFSVTVNDESSNPVDGVEVWISTDSAGASVVAGTLSTDALGVATFMLDAGTYYLWRQRSGYNFTNPVTIVVS